MRVKTCLRFPGGKFYAVKNIRPFYQIPHEEFREVFAGGISVLLDKKLAPKLNWINDIHKELTTFYKVIQDEDKRRELFELLKGEVANKARHKEVKEMKPHNEIETAFKFFYLNRTSFSGIMVKPRWGYMLGSSVTPNRWIDIIEPVANKLQNVKITCWDFNKVIRFDTGNKKVLMYLDPPYFQASKAIYMHEFSEKDHMRLCDSLKETRFKFILSYEDCEDIRNMYKWANIHEIGFTYFMSEGRRQSGKELVITNFKLPQLKLSKFISY